MQPKLDKYNLPTFPTSDEQYAYQGITRIEYIATRLLQGMLANPSWKSNQIDELVEYAFSVAKLVVDRGEVKYSSCTGEYLNASSDETINS